MELPKSAVAVIETPGFYVVERRPDLPGRLAYPGKLQLLGGHVEAGEEFAEALLRELGEETTLDPAGLTPEYEWDGPYLSRDHIGRPMERHIGLFRVAVHESFELRDRPGQNVQSQLVEIHKDREAVEAVAAEMTPFAYWALVRVIGNRREQ